MAKSSSLDQKLDMSLEDLVDRRPSDAGDRGRKRDRLDDDERGGRGPVARRGDYRDRSPFERRGKGNGKSGKRRLPPEDKALLHTTCFHNDEGSFVVRLHETAVFSLRKRASAAGSDVKAVDPAAKAEGKAETTDASTGDQPKAETTNGTESKPESEAVAGEEKKADAEVASGEKTDVANGSDSKADAASGAEADAKADNKSEPVAEGSGAGNDTNGAANAASEAAVATPTSGTVAVLSSGGFKTIETRFILNEALRSVGLCILEERGSGGRETWTLTGTAVPSQAFEDGMEIDVPDAAACASAVKETLLQKIADAKERDTARAKSSSQQGRQDFDYARGGGHAPPRYPPGPHPWPGAHLAAPHPGAPHPAHPAYRHLAPGTAAVQRPPAPGHYYPAPPAWGPHPGQYPPRPHPGWGAPPPRPYEPHPWQGAHAAAAALAQQHPPPQHAAPHAQPQQAPQEAAPVRRSAAAPEAAVAAAPPRAARTAQPLPDSMFQ